ncbi:hypothetical protein GGI03_000404 [Coemansia sp. RSA 2337]|nr:hypothetical protein GGH13_001611 [Coemansia sp. S155-1]KAJ2101895.1 hypothetical protein GGI09_001507 [Coemansia sp. S100]KAJ2354044.1 hypothetical protein GGH92_000284 [Coemansia sp. RSA 2673]KAJ2469398.1 hypothetical protein GGI03_000404 [Coemansia sp. RSA 2337]
MTYCPKDQSARRAELARSLLGRGHYLSLSELLRALHLSEAFGKYMASTSGMLFPVAQLAPALVNGQLQSRVDSGQAVEATSATMTRAFRDIWDYIGHACKAVYPVAEPISACRFSDQRTMRAGGVPAKPDGVFYYPKYLGSEFHSVHALLEAQLDPELDATSPDVLGKMADLAMSVWEAQPTRLFVPFLYLHGTMVSLVLFARGGYYCTTIGRLFHTSHDPSTDDISDVGDTLRYLWFFMTLPSDRFGHIVDVSVLAAGIRFSKFHGATVAVGKGDGSVVDFQQRIPLPVSLLDFQSYLFKTQYHGQPAMLKLVWSPNYRLPEAVVYDWLLSNGCGAVPKVFESSIIASDVFGYRLEYLLIEDCGVPLLEYFKTEYGNVSDSSRRDSAEGVFKQLASCLAIAYSADVIHCDVSAEHISVRNGHAFIFDWTRAQLATAKVPALLAKVLREKYSLSASDLQPLRWPRDDPVVQTAIYASIRSLWHDGSKSLVDRFESLFYVILHALYHSNHSPVGTPSAFEDLSVSAMALVKTGCVADPDLYLSYFGIADIGKGLRTFLDKVRRFLFCPDGIFVGGKLVENGFGRAVRRDLVKTFLSEKAIAAAYPESGKPVHIAAGGAVRSTSLASCAHLFPPATRGVTATAATTTSAPAASATASASAVSAPEVAATATSASVVPTTTPAPAVSETTTRPAVPAPAPEVTAPAPTATISAAPTEIGTAVSATTAIPAIRPDSAVASSSKTTTAATSAVSKPEPKVFMKELAKAAGKALETARAIQSDASTSAVTPATSASATSAIAVPVTTYPFSVFGTPAFSAPSAPSVNPAVAPLFGSITPKPVYSFSGPSYFVPQPTPAPTFRLGEIAANQATDTWVFGSNAPNTSSVVISGTSYPYFGSLPKPVSNSEPEAASGAVASTSASAPVPAPVPAPTSSASVASAPLSASTASAPTAPASAPVEATPLKCAQQ